MRRDRILYRLVRIGRVDLQHVDRSQVSNDHHAAAAHNGRDCDVTFHAVFLRRFRRQTIFVHRQNIEVAVVHSAIDGHEQMPQRHHRRRFDGARFVSQVVDVLTLQTFFIQHVQVGMIARLIHMAQLAGPRGHSQFLRNGDVFQRLARLRVHADHMAGLGSQQDALAMDHRIRERLANRQPPHQLARLIVQAEQFVVTAIHGNHVCADLSR